MSDKTKPVAYLVLRGFDYVPNGRAEAGETRDDLPERIVGGLLRRGVIQKTKAKG